MEGDGWHVAGSAGKHRSTAPSKPSNTPSSGKTTKIPGVTKAKTTSSNTALKNVAAKISVKDVNSRNVKLDRSGPPKGPPPFKN